MSEPRHDIQLQPARIAKILGILAATLVLLHLATLFFRFGLGHGRVLGFVPEFDLNRENNVPTYFSSSLLLIATALLALIASRKREAGGKFRRHWMALAVIFFLMSIDETASLHERLNEPMRELLDAGGWFYFAWVIPGLAVAAVFALAYFRFFLYLAKRFKVLFAASAALYLAGAAGMEMISGRYADAYGLDNAVYAFMTTVEETMEMASVVLFIYALLTYIDTHFPEVRFQTRKSQMSGVLEEV